MTELNSNIPANSREARTVFEAFMITSERATGHDFLCIPPSPSRAYYPDGLDITYAQARANILFLRQKYKTAGYGVGHRVALLLENRPEFFYHYLALNGLGVSIVPINPDYRHDEMLYQMEHSESDLVVSISKRILDLKQVAKERKKPLPIIDAENLPSKFQRPKVAVKTEIPALTTECALLYTSGTTGRPKACILTNFYYLNAGKWYCDLDGLISLRWGQERIYNPLPLFHMNNQAITATAMILSAGCLIMPERFSPKAWWQDVVITRATGIHYLGVVPPLLLNQAECWEEKQHHIRFGIGAGVEPELHAKFEERFKFPLIEIWGMTETGRIFADHIDPRQVNTRAFGRAPMRELEAKVVDAEGRDVAQGTPGELLVRAAGHDPRMGFFSGYLKNAEATEDAWRGGWFNTGDVVYQQADGMLIFVDRLKNIIRRSGENIAAAEIEATIQPHPDVGQVAVIAVLDEIREEEVMACIVPMPNTIPGKELANNIFDWCMQRLAYFKVPGWILFLDCLPTTGTQKIQKTQIFPSGTDPRQYPGVIDLRAQKKRS